MTKRKPASRKKRPGRKPAITPKEAISIARKDEALQLYRAGYDYATIGSWLNPPVGRTRAYELIRDALAEMKADTNESVEQVRQIELQRLDEMMIKPLEAAKNGDVRAIDAVLKIMDRRAQIMGIDAPKKQEHSGPDGGEIPLSRVEIVIVDPAGDRA